MSARRAFPWLIFAGVLAVALNLRSHMFTAAPVAQRNMDDLDVSAAAAGALTTMPMFVLALCMPVGALVVRRAGPELAVLVTLAGSSPV